MTNNPQSGGGSNGGDESMNAGHDRQGGMTRRSLIASTAAAAGLLSLDLPLLAEVAGTAQGQTAPEAKDWSPLRGRIKGTVVTADAPDFATARSELVWNGIKPDRSPEVIVNPTVKAGGYLLNGGMSWNMGHWGPACASVLAIEFVTADGKKVKASATEHADLFWAARGCGPGMFAVATRFHLKCYPLPKAITSSTHFYSLNDLREAVDDVTALGRKMPDNVELSIFLIKAPPELAEKCKDSNGKVCMVAAVAFGMTKEESERALAPLEEGTMVKKALLKSLNEPSSFETQAINAGQSWPDNHRNLCENQCSKAKPSDMLMAVRDKFIAAPSAKSVMVFCQSTGAKNLLEPNPDVALSMDATSYGGSWAIWEKAEDDAANFKWQDEIIAIMKPFTSQHHIGETDIVQDPARVQESYSAEKWKRLEEIRAKYDPQGVFFGFLGGTAKA